MDEQARRAKQALLLAAGVEVLATVPRDLVALGDSAQATITVVDHGAVPVTLYGRDGAFGPRVVSSGAMVEQPYELKPVGIPTMPWWLEYPRQGDMFRLRAPNDNSGAPVPQLLEGADRVEGSHVDVVLEIAGTRFVDDVSPIVHRFADPATGVVNRPVAFVPPITVLLPHDVEYARANAPIDRVERVVVRSDASATRTATVNLRLPVGLKADSASRTITLAPGTDVAVDFRVRGTLSAGAYAIAATATSNGTVYRSGFITVDYPHIHAQRYYRDAQLRLQAVDVNYAAGMSVAYIPGVGDNVAPMLTELGLQVSTITPEALPETNLSQYSVVVVGPRAFDASVVLRANNARLLDYARKGGTLVEQYGQYGMAQPGLMPYPITLARPADRVTEEDAAVTILDPTSPILNTPNKINQSDFANWVQERSSYMPHTFDDRYHAILSMHDTGEAPNDAGILVAPLGKGVFAYVTLTFFRQLPAGNPGAARLFVNILSAKPNAVGRPLHPVPLVQ